LLKEDWVNVPLPQLSAAAIAEYRDRRLASVKPANLKRQLHWDKGKSMVQTSK